MSSKICSETTPSLHRSLSLSLSGFPVTPSCIFFSRSHFKTTSVTVPELGVGETAVAASSGVSIVARRVGTG